MAQALSMPKFSRVLLRSDVLALSFGAMIGWGWVVMTGHWILSAGSLGAVAAFVVGGSAIMLVGLTYAELASAMPQVGGEHVYCYRALGHFSSFLCTWLIVFGYVAVVAFEAVALPTVMEHLFPNYAVGHLWTISGWEVKATWVAVGVLGSLAMIVINYMGVVTAALFQKVVTVLFVVIGVAFIAAALVGGDSVALQPLFIESGGEAMAGVLVVLIMVPFMFVGFDVIPQAAEEIDLPYRDIGRILMLSVVMAIFWYSLIIVGTALVLDDSALSESVLAVPDAAAALFNTPLAGYVMVVAGLAGIVTSWNAFYLGGSRAIYALANSGMLPAFLAKLHPRFKTPTNAILLMGVLSCIAPFLGRPAMVWLVNAGGLGIVSAYLFVAIAFIVLRRREPGMRRPFRVLFGPAVGIGAIVVSLAMILLYLPGSPAALGPVEWVFFGGWMLLGIGMYCWSRARYGVEHSDRVIDAEIRRHQVATVPAETAREPEEADRVSQ